MPSPTGWLGERGSAGACSTCIADDDDDDDDDDDGAGARAVGVGGRGGIMGKIRIVYRIST